MSFKSVAQLEKKTLRRVLRVFDLFAVGYGDLGSSIYYALGITVLFSLGATPISLALAGIVFLFTALTYAELASLFPESGGVATFTRYAFNDLISFIAGWGLLLDYIVTIAISSFAIEPYLRGVINFETSNHLAWHILFTLVIIAILFFLNFIGVKHSTKLSSILTVFTIITQFIIIAIGIVFILNVKDLILHMKIGGMDRLWSPSWDGFLQGTVMAMVAYTGIESMAQLSAETKHPGRNIPRAIMWVIVVLLASYFGISLVALSAVSPQVLGTTYLENPIAGIVEHLPFAAHFLTPWLGVLAAMLLFVAANSGLIGSSRLSFFMSEHYQLPRFFFAIHPKFRTPYVALAVFAVLASLIVLLSHGKMLFFADLYNFGAMIAFFSAHIALIVLRIKKPDAARPFRAPFNITIKGYSIPLTAILGGICTFAVWILVIVTKPSGRICGLSWLIIGAIIYFVYRKKKKIAPLANVQIEKIHIPEYTPLHIKNILVPTRGGAYTENVQVACELAKIHKAQITALYVVDVPFAMPIEGAIPQKMDIAEAVLKRADAIAREYNLTINMKIIKARNISEAILTLLGEENFDLVVIGARGKHGLGPTVEKLLKESNTRIWICKS